MWPGFYRDLGNAEDRGSFGTSSSQLKKLMEKTPAHLDFERRNPRESTAAMHRGTEVHCGGALAGVAALEVQMRRRFLHQFFQLTGTCAKAPAILSVPEVSVKTWPHDRASPRLG